MHIFFQYGGAVRVSDIGHASFTKCSFIGNAASDKGGAIATQIENPEENMVSLLSRICVDDH